MTIGLTVSLYFGIKFYFRIEQSAKNFYGSIALHDMRTNPTVPISLENLHGSGSVHIVINDNTDPMTLKDAKMTGSGTYRLGG